jgi:hypothetical protein
MFGEPGGCVGSGSAFPLGRNGWSAEVIGSRAEIVSHRCHVSDGQGQEPDEASDSLRETTPVPYDAWDFDAIARSATSGLDAI